MSEIPSAEILRRSKCRQHRARCRAAICKSDAPVLVAGKLQCNKLRLRGLAQ